MKTKIYLTPTDEPIDIRFDNVFKAVFTKEIPESEKALSGLVSALIGREITIISIRANEPAIDNIRDRQIRFDINCRAKTGERIDVEISYNPDADEPIRLEFYATKLFIGQDIRGSDKKYDDLKQTYQIAILAKEKFFLDNKFFHTFEYYDPINKVSLNGKTKIITLELCKLDEIVEKSTEEMSVSERWAVFLEYLTDKEKRGKINEILEKEEDIAMASQVLLTISRDEDESARLLSEYKYELDMQSHRVNAERQGLAKGLKEGLEKGLEKGRKEERNEIALKMKNAGEVFSKITEFTGLSLEAIEKL